MDPLLELADQGIVLARAHVSDWEILRWIEEDYAAGEPAEVVVGVLNDAHMHGWSVPQPFLDAAAAWVATEDEGTREFVAQLLAPS